MAVLPLLLMLTLMLMIVLLRRLPRGPRAAVLAAIACATLGIFPLVGLPGALIVELSRPILALTLGSDAYAALPADAGWPLAIIVTLLWPISIIFGHVLAHLLLRVRSRFGRLLVFAVVLYAWGAALSTWVVRSAEASGPV